MNGKRATIAMFFVVLLLVVFIYRRWQEPRRHELFDRTPKHLSYTKHALCRMDCRHISREDVEEIMEQGVINLNRSNRNARPCPTFALQGETKDSEHLRIVFAQCEEETRVVTCINLDEDFECHCPGDPSEKPDRTQKKN
jgi:hypothetical protein